MRKIDFSKSFKVFVKAYDSQGKRLGKSVTAYVAGKNNDTYTNPKAIKIAKKAYTLTVGQTKKINAKLKMTNNDKKLLAKKKIAKFRYSTSDKAVATVSKKGVIKAVGSGNCEIYVYAKNGKTKKINVTVK